MNHALWITKKNQICILIKKISDHYGGDDIEWLRDYCKDVIGKNKDHIQALLDGCWDLEEQIKYIPKNMEVLRGTLENRSGETV